MTQSIGIHQFPEKLPILEASGFVLLPRGNLPLTVQDSKQIKLVDYIMAHGRYVGVVQQKPSPQGTTHLFQTGCLGKINTFSEAEPHRYVVVLTGLSRFRLDSVSKNSQGIRMGQVSYTPFSSDAHPLEAPEEENQGKEDLIERLHTYLKRHGINANWDEIATAPHENLVTAISMLCPFDPFEKQALLESNSLEARAEMATRFMEMATHLLDPSKTRH